MLGGAQVGELHLFHVLFHLDCVAYKPAAALPAGLKEFYANTLALPGVRPAPAPAPARPPPPRPAPCRAPAGGPGLHLMIDFN